MDFRSDGNGDIKLMLGKLSFADENLQRNLEWAKQVSGGVHRREEAG